MRPIIQCLWIGDSLSLMEQLSIRSFLKNGHGYHLYVYEEVMNVPEGVVLKDANDVVSSSQIFKYRQYDTYSAFSNLFRYKLLLENGGYWADTDVVCLKSFDFNSDYVFAEERLFYRKTVCNNIIKVPAVSPIMQYCYEIALSKSPDQLHWGETGPDLLTAAVAKFHLTSFIRPYQIFNPLSWWEWQDFIHGGLMTSTKLKWRLKRNTYAIHFWNEMWRRNKADKNQTYPAQSLYERLKQTYL